MACLVHDGSTCDGAPANKWQHPPSFYCPISQQCMHDPVVLSDGHSYERRHIERWLQDHTTSPVSGLSLEQKALFPNHALRNAIEEYFQQVFSLHRRAIRKTMGGLDTGTGGATSNASLVRTIDALMQCSLLMNADLTIEEVLRSIMEEAKTLLGAEVASVFLLDAENQELYSTVNSTGGELRIPVTVGIAGHVARSGEALVVHDAYTDGRFDRTVDTRTGFRTRNIMCVPLKDRKGGVMGVAQLINKSSSESLRSEQTQSPTGLSTGSPVAVEDAPLPDNFTADDQHFFMVFASQAATAITNGGAFGALTAPQVASPLGSSPLASPHKAKWGAGPLELKEGPAMPAEWGEEDPAAAEQLMEGALGSWELDAFALAKVTANKPLSVLGMYLFYQLGLVKEFSLSKGKLARFLGEIESGYRAANPYHNSTHAASVLHSMHALLQHGGMAEAVAPRLEASSPALVRMACLLAAAVHDYEHEGLTNDFLVKTGHERAIRYNDQHVNENHHAAAAFAVLLRDECNFLELLPAQDYRLLRRIVIELVLGTDMSRHDKLLQSARDSFAPASSSSSSSSVEAVLTLQLAIKAADLGHFALSWESHSKWVKCLEEEFFLQGDREKELGLPISFLMDRCKPGASATQVGFCENVALPLFCLLASVAPGTEPALVAVRANLQLWKEREAPGSGPEPDAASPSGAQGSGAQVPAKEKAALPGESAAAAQQTPKRRGPQRLSEPPAVPASSSASWRPVAPPTAAAGGPARAASTAASRSSGSTSEGERSGLRKRRSGRARQRAARWWAAVRRPTPSPSPAPPDAGGA